MSVFGTKGKKSDDSILQDAEDARTRERQGKVSADDQLEHTFDEIADSAAKAKAEGASADRVAAIEKQLAEVKRMLSESMTVRTASTAQQEAIRERALKKSEIPQCPMCHQYITVCGGKPDGHTTIRVLPERPEHQPHFPGVRLNNVEYCGTAVVVPKACAQDILGMVRNYSEYRFNLNLNRGKMLGLGGRKFVAENMSRDGMPIL